MNQTTLFSVKVRTWSEGWYGIDVNTQNIVGIYPISILHHFSVHFVDG